MVVKFSVVTDSDDNAVARALLPRMRFAAEKLAERAVRTLHVEHVAPAGFSRCACGKETTPWWLRMRERFFVEGIDALNGQPLGAYELCERCLRSADVPVWLRQSLGWTDEAVTTDDSGTTYRWSNGSGEPTSVFRHEGWAPPKEESVPGQGDLFDGANGDDKAGEDIADGEEIEE